MKTSLLSRLRCPVTGASLRLRNAELARGEVKTGELVASNRGPSYPIIDFIPRFVPAENYTESFGLQWQRFQRTQLDSCTGLTISRDRFFAYTGWNAEDLEGKWVLDAGCGAGRFAEIALSCGARLVAVDYSQAADVCQENLCSHPNLDVVQADIRALPFAPEQFDYVYCLGVLQHTPDPRRAFLALSKLVRTGGRIAFDIYPRLWRNILWPKYWMRPLTRRIAPERMFDIVNRVVPILLPISRAIARIPGIGPKLRYAVPVANYEGVYPLSRTQLEEWAVLDTYDMFAPKHDHPQTLKRVREWLLETGLEEEWIGRLGFIVARATKT